MQQQNIKWGKLFIELIVVLLIIGAMTMISEPIESSAEQGSQAILFD